MSSVSSSSRDSVNSQAELQLKAKRFVQSAYEMAMRNEPIVGFSTDGTTLEIRDVPKLCEEVLPKYFKHKNISSFFRQLNMYGFEKVAFDGAAHAFRHDFFRKDRADLLDQVSRSNSARKPTKSRRSSGAAPKGSARLRDEPEDEEDDEDDESIAHTPPVPTSTKVRGEQPRRMPPSDALQTKLKPFVYAAYEMVTNNEGSHIGFSSDGTALEIRDVTLFSEKILPKYFKHKNISSFIRQLNMYGFEKIDGVASKSSSTTGVIPHTFFHEYFRRGHEDWLPLIVRKTKVKRADDVGSQSKKLRGSGEDNVFEGDSPPQTSSSSSSSKKIHRFIESTYNMAVYGKHPEVGMSVDGAVLEIRDSNNFTRLILPQYFSHRDLTAFVRQLSMYGFDQVGENRFKHPYFIRHREDLLDKVVPAHSAPVIPPSQPLKSVWSDVDEANSHVPAALMQLRQSPSVGNTPSLQTLLGSLNAASSNPTLSEIATRFQPVPSHPSTVLANTQKLQSLLHASLSNVTFHPSSTASMAASVTAQSEFSEPSASDVSLRPSLTRPNDNDKGIGNTKFPPPIALPSSATSSSGSSSTPTAVLSDASQQQPKVSPRPLASTEQVSRGTAQESEHGVDDENEDENDDEEDMQVAEDSQDEDEDDSGDDEESSSQIINSAKGNLNSVSKSGKIGNFRKQQRLRGTPPFVHSAFDIVQLDNEAVGWNVQGTALEIRDETMLANEILPKFFKHNNVSSFVRQLNMYGFEKTVGHINAVHTFQHQYFKRDRPDLLVLINRKQNKNGVVAVPASPAVLSKRMMIDMSQQDSRAKKSELFLKKELALKDSEKSSGPLSTIATAATAAAAAGGASSPQTRSKPTPFVHSTYELASLNNEAIGFSRNGTSLEIRNEAVLADLYLAKYFKHKNVSSFIRQLNMYGFEKTESPPGVAHTFQHEYFKHNRDDLLPKISRKHVKFMGNNPILDGTSTRNVDELFEDQSLDEAAGPAKQGERRGRGGETMDAITGLTMLKQGQASNQGLNNVQSSEQQQQQSPSPHHLVHTNRIGSFGWEAGSESVSNFSMGSPSASTAASSAFQLPTHLGFNAQGGFSSLMINGLPPHYGNYAGLKQSMTNVTNLVHPSFSSQFSFPISDMNNVGGGGPANSQASVGILSSTDQATLSNLPPPKFFSDRPQYSNPTPSLASLMSQLGPVQPQQHQYPTSFVGPSSSSLMASSNIQSETAISKGVLTEVAASNQSK